jgi:hypothetical protein
VSFGQLTDFTRGKRLGFSVKVRNLDWATIADLFLDNDRAGEIFDTCFSVTLISVKKRRSN